MGSETIHSSEEVSTDIGLDLLHSVLPMCTSYLVYIKVDIPLTKAPQYPCLWGFLRLQDYGTNVLFGVAGLKWLDG